MNTTPERVRYRPWTTYEERRLRALLKQNLTYHEIAQKLGRTPAAVATRARMRLGLTKQWVAVPRKEKQ